MKLNLVFLNALAVAAVANVGVFSFASIRSKIKRVMKIEVNNDARIPMLKVTAKPWIGPSPNLPRTNAVSKVVMFESRIAE